MRNGGRSTRRFAPMLRQILPILLSLTAIEMTYYSITLSYIRQIIDRRAAVVIGGVMTLRCHRQ